jgi:hypothetical protein
LAGHSDLAEVRVNIERAVRASTTSPRAGGKLFARERIRLLTDDGS